MELSTAIRAVFRSFRRHPAGLLPFYMLGLGVPAIVRVLTFVGLAALLGYLLAGNRIEAFLTELERLEPAPDPETEPEAFFEWAESLQPVIETVVTPTSVILLVLTIVVTIVGLVLLTAAVSAGQIGSCAAVLRQERGAVGGIRAFRSHWLQFIGLYLLELFLWVIVTSLLLGVVAVSIWISPVLAIFVAIFAALCWLAAVVLIRAVFVFAPIAVVIDDATVFGSLRLSAGFIRQEFMHAVSYYVISIGVLLLFAGFSSTVSVFGAPTISALLSFIVLTPALDLFKTVLFGSYRDAVNPPEPVADGLWHQSKRGLSRSLGETASFVRETPLLHSLSLGTMLIGFAMGWFVAGPLVGEFEASISARIEGIIPPVAALEFFGNNWSVAISTAFAGVAAGIPTAVGLWFNGLVFAIMTRLEESLLELAAFVIPHGVLEIPAIIIAGALGYYLGLATWRTWRGRSSRRDLAGALERSVWILFGIGVLLAVAAVIEGFISPFYFRLFL